MHKYLFFLILSCSLFACHQSENIDRSDALASARGFIESSLKGDYVRAEKYVVPDSTNIEYLNIFRDIHTRRTPLERESYRDANIIIDSTQKISDSSMLITYSNTYKNEPTQLKMVRKNSEWFVDFKYTFNKQHN